MVQKPPARLTRVSGASSAGNSRQNDEWAKKRKHGRHRQQELNPRELSRDSVKFDDVSSVWAKLLAHSL
jgi:hypothetical protein